MPSKKEIVSMIIEIETKEGMSEKALNILHDLKDIVFEKVVVKDSAYSAKQQELNSILENAINNPQTLKSHDEVWNEIESLTRK
jgi:hypothetical protein